MTNADVTMVLVGVFGVMFSIIGFYTAMLIRDVRGAIRENTRHIQATMAATWSLNWRVTTAEDWLQERDGYHPPRIVNNPSNGTDL